MMNDSKVLVENLEAHEVLVEQNLAQLLVHNMNVVVTGLLL